MVLVSWLGAFGVSLSGSRRAPSSVRKHRAGHRRIEILESRLVLSGTSVTSIAPQQALFSTQAQFAVTFNSVVTGVGASDFQVFTTGDVAVADPLAVSGSGQNYQVTVTGISGNGSLGLKLVDDGTIRDQAGDPLVESGALAAFAAARSFPTYYRPVSVVAGDVNGDGRPDLAVVDFNYDGKISVLLGNGDGSFATAQNFATGGSPVYPRAVALADMNGDGHLDLVVVNEDRGEVRIMRGNGDGTFASNAPQYPTSKSPVALAVGDLNQDGHPDVVVANSGNDTVGVLLGTATGSLGAQQTFAVGSVPVSVSLGDVNGDGYLDAVTANKYGNSVSVLLGQGNGTFNSQTAVTTGTQPTCVKLADLDGDSRLDLAVSNSTDNTVSILLGNGNGTFNAAANSPAGSLPYSLAVADLNGDSRLDLAIANKSSGMASVLLGNGNGTFAAARTFSIASSAFSIAITDTNGDGRPDLITTDYNDILVNVLLGNGDGTFRDTPAVAAGKQPMSVAAGDVNGDGHADLAVANSTDNTVSLLLGNGNGTFQAARNLGTGNTPRAVVIGDVNGDGQPDLAAGVFGGVSLLLGNGNGTFATSSLITTSTIPYALLLDDLNGDGHPDLVLANKPYNSVTVLLGNGNGTFAAARNLATGNGPRSVAMGDYNDDGKLDLVSANAQSKTLSLLLANGNGTFAPAQNLAMGPNPVWVATGDINGDGQPDLVVANDYPANSVTVLLGNGDGTFAAPQNYRMGFDPDFAVIADLNGDGRPDVAVADNGNDTIGVLLGNGNGTFIPPQFFLTGKQPCSIAAADLNGDDRLDLVATDLNENRLDILLANGNGNFIGETAAIDQTPPTAFVAASTVTSPGTGTFTFTVTYDDDSGVDATTFSSTNISVTGPNNFQQVAAFVTDNPVGGGSNAYLATYSISVPAGSWHTADNGQYTVSVLANSVRDIAGNAVPAGAIGSFDVNVDTTPPTAVLTASDVTTSAGPTYRFSVVYSDNRGINFSTLGNGDVTVTGPNGFNQSATLVSVDIHSNGTPRTATYSISVPNASWHTTDNGTYTVSQAAGAVADTTGLSAASGAVGTFKVTVDTVPPTVAWTPVASPRATAVDAVRCTFSEPMANASLANFALNGTSIGSLSGTTIAGFSGNTFVIGGLAPYTSSGNPAKTYTVTAASGNTLKDLSGNALSSTSGVTWVIDKAPPTAVWSQVSTPRNSATASVVISFSELVQNVALTNFTLNGTRISNLSGVTLGGSQYAYVIGGLTPYTGTAGATYTVAVASGNTLKDLVGNAFSGLPSMHWTVDKTNPTATWTAVPSPGNSSVAAVRITFSEAMKNADLTNFTLNGTQIRQLPGTTISAFSGNTYVIGGLATWTANGNPTNYTVAVAANNTLTDLAGNSLSSLPGVNWLTDKVPPTGTWTAVATPTQTAVGAARITFSEPVQHVTTADFTLNGTALSLLSGVAITGYSGNVYVVSGLTPYTGQGNPTKTYTLAAASGNAIKDAVGNALSGRPAVSWSMDTSAPTGTWNSVTTPTKSAVPAVTIHFSEAVQNVTLANFTLNGTRLSNLTGVSIIGYASSNSYVISGLSAYDAVAKTYTVAVISSNTINDLAGNALSGAPGVSWVVTSSATSAARAGSAEIDSAAALYTKSQDLDEYWSSLAGELAIAMALPFDLALL